MRYLKFFIFICLMLINYSCIIYPPHLPPFLPTEEEEEFIQIDASTFKESDVESSEIELFKDDPKTNYDENVWIFTKDSQGNITQVGSPKIPSKEPILYIYTETLTSIPETVGDIMTSKNRGEFKNKGISPETLITTWIFFLIPHSALYLRNELMMEEFWRQFINLGNRIGDVSCTIWFTIKDCKTKERWRCYNAEIAQRDYIDRFIHTDKLAPYVLITTKHPHKCSKNDEVDVLYMKGISVEYFCEMLRDLTDYIDKNYKNKIISTKSLRLLWAKYWLASRFKENAKFVKKLVKDILN